MPVKGLLAGFGAPQDDVGSTTAVEKGLKAYEGMSNIRQRDQSLALQGQEGARAEKRLSMAEQLLPGQLTAQQQANKAQEQNIEAVARQVTADREAQAEFAQIHRDAASGKLKDPDELEMRIGSALIKSRNAAKVEQWFANREKLLRGGKVAEHLQGIATKYMEAAAQAAENPKDPMVWARTVVQMNKEHPLGTPTSELYKAAIKRMDAAFESLPGPVGAALKEYSDLRAVMGASQAWSKALSSVNPAYQADFNKHMPPDVKAEFGALAKGAEEKAGAEGKLPSELRKIEATGAQQRALEQEKEKAREARAKLPPKVLQKLLDNATKDIGQIRTSLNQPLIGADDKARYQADLEVALKKRQEYEEALAVTTTKDEGTTPTKPPGALDPKKVRAEKIGPITVLLRQKAKSLEDSKRALDHNLSNKAISQAEYDQLLSAETKRWGAK